MISLAMDGRKTRKFFRGAARQMRGTSAHKQSEKKCQPGAHGRGQFRGQDWDDLDLPDPETQTTSIRPEVDGRLWRCINSYRLEWSSGRVKP